MSKKDAARNTGEDNNPAPDVSIMVCHGCCCGTKKKNPGINHTSQRAHLLALESDSVRVRVVDCLDVCKKKNVVLVRDYSKPRKERDTWLKQMHHRTELDAVAEWVANPSEAAPAVLEKHIFEPDRKHKAPKDNS